MVEQSGKETGAAPNPQPEVAIVDRGVVEVAPGSPAPATTSTPPGLDALRDRRSSMAPRFNLFFRWFARRFFSHFRLDPDTVEKLRELESRGSIVYVMRYSSRLDYFLFNTLFNQVGLRLSLFANGLAFYYYRPLWDALRTGLLRPRGRPKEVEHSEDQEHARTLVSAGGSLFLFLRTARLRSWLRGRRARRRQDELDLLREVVRAVWSSDRDVYVVPLALFWRKGPRSESRFLNLSYGSHTRPSDLAKVTSFLANYRSLSVHTGEPIDLQRFIADHRDDGEDRVARKVRRMILMYLYREEKVVEGPTLRAPHRVQEVVVSDSRVQAAIGARAKERGGSVERAHADAEKMFREIAANMNSTFLAALAAIVGGITRRMFASIEVGGLEKVAEYAKRHPIVLVPSHRSYFDFLIVSWLFYQNFLVPPHIYARDNMAFGPFGLVFRRAGAFFARASFDDPLYKEVFRAYVAYLVREGFTQEFFIEGGRSRTGKMRAPRFGMLSWDVDAFLESARRDLFLVPISITYERLVEESSMVDELEGQAKTRESVLGLVRARKYLQRRFGSVHVNFDEPISLADALGAKREAFAFQDGQEVAAQKREFVASLGHRIVERINWSAVANATSVAGCVLLGSPHRGLVRSEFIARMQRFVDLLRAQGVSFTQALVSDEGDFRESISFLLRSDLIQSTRDPIREILYYEESRRRALDIYRNSIVHYFAAPSILARRLLAVEDRAEPGISREGLREDVAAWQELLYQEFFAPSGEIGEGHFELFIAHFEREGWVELKDGLYRPTRASEPFLRCLAEQTRGPIEAYLAACTALLEVEDEIGMKEFQQRAGEHYANAQLLGEANRSEAANETTFDNALDLLGRRGVIVRRATGKGRSREMVCARGENWEALRTMAEHLAAALASR